MKQNNFDIFCKSDPSLNNEDFTDTINKKYTKNYDYLFTNKKKNNIKNYHTHKIYKVNNYSECFIPTYTENGTCTNITNFTDSSDSSNSCCNTCNTCNTCNNCNTCNTCTNNTDITHTDIYFGNNFT
jgi:hypothetical protein